MDKSKLVMAYAARRATRKQFSTAPVEMAEEFDEPVAQEHIAPEPEAAPPSRAEVLANIIKMLRMNRED